MTTLPTLPVLAAAPPRVVDGQMGEDVDVVQHTCPDELVAPASAVAGRGAA